MPGDSFTPIPNSDAARLVDTRKNRGLSGPSACGIARTFQVTGTVVPAGATAITGNLTVTGQTHRGFLALGPVPQNKPTNSTLNFPLGDDRANGVTVGITADGKLSVTYMGYAVNGLALDARAHVVFDVTGYFSATP